MDILITAKTVPLAIKSSIPLITRMYDLFRPEAQIEFEIKGSNYEHTRVPFFWIYDKAKGAALKVTIKGKPGTCQAIAGYLVATALRLKGTNKLNENDCLESIFIDKIPLQSALVVKPVVNSNWSSFFDFFRFQSVMKFELTGEDYESKRFLFLYSKESGRSISVSIMGKPFFVESCSQFIDENSEVLKELLLTTKLLK